VNIPRNREWLGMILLVSLAFGADQKRPKDPPARKPADRITQVETVKVANGEIITRIIVDLQRAPDNMEPKAEPRRIQVDDRANVQIRLRNLSPLDVCSLNGRTPAATAETNVAESLVGTIAKLSPFAIAPGLVGPNFQLNSVDKMLEGITGLTVRPEKPTCKIESDPEYLKVLSLGDDFTDAARKFAGDGASQPDCGKNQLKAPPAPNINDTTQATLACQLDAASRTLTDYQGRDFREKEHTKFKLDDEDLKKVKGWFATPIPSLTGAGNLQAMVDAMTAWTADLHKKYDFQVSAGDSGPFSTVAVPTVNGSPAVAVVPVNVNFTYLNSTPPAAQTIAVSSGTVAAAFAVSTSGQPWLKVSPDCSNASPCRTGTAGTFNLSVSVDPRQLGANKESDTAAIIVAGIAPAVGMTIVNVSLKPAAGTGDCELKALRKVDEILDRAKATMALIASNNAALQTAQTNLKTNYMALAKVVDDFSRRKEQKIVSEDGGVLIQDFNLGTDRKATITGNLSCVSDVYGKTPTTDAINFSILYQDVPHWSASAGLLTTLQRKRIIGIVDQPVTPATNPPTFTPDFGITDQARAQVLPMAFVNYRLTPYHFHYDKLMSHYGRNREDTLVWTAHVSGGIGVNSNNGANQPEFFLGLALGLNRFMIHPGFHFGRMQSLGGGYTLGTQAPDKITVPINWSYHPAFSIGFSVRLAPY